MLLKLILLLFLIPSLAIAQNTKPLIVTDNGANTCNATRMVVSSGSLSCSGSVATVTTGGGGGSGTVTSIATTSPITGGTITTTGTIGINQSNTSTNGYLSSTDWNTFNGKQSALSGLTTNFITKATSSTAIGNSQIFDNGTNIGIGTSTNTRSKLDVLGNLDARGNITIKTPTFNTTDGQYQGVGSLQTLFPASGTGAINDIETILPYHQGQLTYTVNGAGSGMALFNGSYLFGYALTVTGITVAPTHNATYNNGVCTQTIFATNLTAGAGTISVHSNCALSATGTTNKTGGTGDASFSWTASNTLPSYAAGMAFPGGLDGFGDPNHPELNSDNNNPVFAIGYGQLGRVTSSDTGVHLQCGIYAPFSSGCSWFSDIMNDDGTVRDPVGSQTSDVQGLVPLEFDGGGVMWIFNPNSYNPRVMGISASSGTGLDSGGNFGGYFFDSTDTYNGKLAMRFPHHIAHVHMPGSKSYIFSGITGVTTAPAPNVNQQPEYSISGGTGEHYDWIKNNLSGGAGTITFESRSTPASSGTLTKITVAGIPIGLGDSTIAYSSVAVENTYQDTMYLDEFNGNVGIDTFVPTKQLDVIGTVKASFFMGDGSGLTNVSGTGGSSQWITTANVGIGTTSNVGIGTLKPTGILSIGKQAVDGREFYITGSNSSANLDIIRGDPDTIDTGASIEENFHTGLSTYEGQSLTIEGGGSLYVASGPNTIDGGLSVGPFAGSTDRTAPAQSIVIGNNVGIGTWKPDGSLTIGSGSSTGRIMSVTGSNQGSNGVITEGDPDNKDSNGNSTTSSFNIHNSTFTWSNLTYEDFGTASICVGCGSPTQNKVTIDGGVSLGAWAGSVDRPVGSNSLVAANNVGIGTWITSQKLDVIGTVKALHFTGDSNGLTGTAASLTAGTVSTISGLITQGTNVTITGSGTSGSPYNISSSGGGAGSNYWNLSAGNIGISTSNNVGIGTIFTTTSALTIMSGNVGIGTWIPAAALDITGTSGNVFVSGNIGIGSSNPGAGIDVAQVGPISAIFPTNVGIGTTLPTGALDVVGTVRALSAGSCTALYKCVGGVDAGVIQTSACVLCPGGSCTQMNGCF